MLHILNTQLCFHKETNLDFSLEIGYNTDIPSKEFTRETKRPWHLAKALHKYPRKEILLMIIMKKPIRLLGVVFQIDQECP